MAPHDLAHLVWHLLFPVCCFALIMFHYHVCMRVCVCMRPRRYMESVKHLRDMLMAYEWDLHGKELAGRK